MRNRTITRNRRAGSVRSKCSTHSDAGAGGGRTKPNGRPTGTSDTPPRATSCDIETGRKDSTTDGQADDVNLPPTKKSVHHSIINLFHSGKACNVQTSMLIIV